MKRIGALLVSLLIIGGAVWLLQPAREQQDLLDLLPSDALAVLDWQHPGDDLAAMTGPEGFFTRHPHVGQEVQQFIDTALPSVLELKDLLWTGKRPKTDQPWRRLLDTRCVFALLPVNSGNGERFSTSWPQAMVMLRRDSGSLFSKKRLLRRIYQAEALPVLRYQGQPIYRFRLGSGRILHIACRKDLQMIALAPGPLFRQIDFLLAHLVRGEKGWGNAPALEQVRQWRSGTDTFFSWMDLRAIAARQYLPRPDKPKTEEKKDNGSGWYPLSQLAVRVSRQGRISSFSLMGIPAQKERGYWRRLARQEPVRDPWIDSLPAMIQMYFRTNWVDLFSLWQLVTRNGTRTPAWLEQVSRRFEQAARLPLKELLILFGRDMGISVKGLTSGAVLPIPRIMFFSENSDVRRLRTIFNGWTEDLPLRQRMIGDIEVVSLVAARGLMLPSYGVDLTGRRFWIADGYDQIEEMVHPGGELLRDQKDFRILTQNGDTTLAENNFFLFMRFPQFVDSMQPLLRWSALMADSLGNREQRKRWLVFTRRARAVLAVLRHLDAMAGRGHHRQGFIELNLTALSR